MVAPAWVGDLVLAEPLLRAMAQAGPVDLLAAPFLHPLIARMPVVRRALTLPFGHGQARLVARFRLGRALRAQAYARAVVLPNSFKSAIVPWGAGIPLRTGYTGEARLGLLNDRRRLDKAALPMTVQRFYALGLPAGAALPEIPHPLLHASAAQQQDTRRALGLPEWAAVGSGAAPGGPLVLCPGAEFGTAKRWPVRHFAAVARHGLARGWPVWLLGSARDAPLTQAVNAAAGGACVDLAGRTDLGQACDLLAGAALVVSNDSGLMHVAAALGRRLVGVFGSSDPRHTPPMGPHARVVSLNLPCSPCFRRECPLGHLNCLEQLAPDRVLAAAEQ